MAHSDILKNVDTDLVSVIIPVYNTEDFVAETIYSVLQQSYTNIELILIDDNSKDGSGKTILEIAKKHPNIHYYKNVENAGVSISRNKGIALAQGRYIAFLDSDDLWKRDKICKQINLMKEKKAVFSYTAIEMINERGVVIRGKIPIVEQVKYAVLLRNTMIATSSVVIDRLHYKDIQMPMIDAEDYATWLSLLRSGEIAYGINESLVQYRIRKGSLSANKFNSIKEVFVIQYRQEGLKLYAIIINICYFIYNALKKHYM